MAREISSEAILQEIYDATGKYDGSRKSLENIRAEILICCLCSEDVSRRQEDTDKYFPEES